MPATGTVFIVDDDPGVRESLRLLLATLGYNVVAFDSAVTFLAQYRASQAGCLVLDVRMPQMSGLDLQQELAARGAMLPVIFITGHGDVPIAVDAMRRGAFDFLQKPFREQDLLDRVQRALAADRAARGAAADRERIQARFESLTPREREVLALITQGYANKRVAENLGVSQRTAEIHRAHVMRKMDVTSLAQLVRMTLLVKGRGTDHA